MIDWNIGLAIVAVPYRVPDHPDWIGNTLGTVAITRGTTTNFQSLWVLEKGRGFVTVSEGRGENLS